LLDDDAIHSCIYARILGAGNWNELVALSEELKAFIPAFPTSLAKEWKRPTLISTNKRFYFVALNLVLHHHPAKGIVIAVCCLICIFPGLRNKRTLLYMLCYDE
jgi:hypothetical protein